MAHPGGRPRKNYTTTEAPQQDFFTVQEAVQLLGLHENTILNRLRDGTMKGKKLGKQWKIYRDSIVNDKVDADLNIEKR